MRERARDSVRWRSSPSRPRDRDRSNWGRSDRRDASSRSGRSPVRSDRDSRRPDVRRTDWEADVGGIRREYGDADPYQAERLRRDGFSKREPGEERDDDCRKKLSRFQRGEFAGEDYPDRCEPVRTEEKSRHGFGGAMRLEEEIYRSHETERSREVDNFVRSTMKQYCRDEPEPSTSTRSHGYSNSVSPVRNVPRNDELDRLGSSGSRHYCDLERLRMQSYRSSDHERAEAVFVSMKSERSGKQCYEHGRERECYVPTSRMSCVGSSSAEMQQDNNRRVSLNSSSVFGVIDLDRIHRIGDRKLGCEGHCCASQVLHTRDLDRYVDWNSSRGFQEDELAKSSRCSSYSRGHSCCYCVSSTAGKLSKDIAGTPPESYDRGGCSSVSAITVKDFCGHGHRMHMGQDPVHYMHMRGPLSKPRDTDSVINEVDGADTIVGFRAGERVSDQYDSVKEHCPFVELGSSMLDDRIDEARNYRKVHYEERKDAYLDSKTQQLRNDYQFDAHATVYPDVNGSDAMIDRGERALQFRRVCRNKGKEAYPDDESQQVQKDYKFVSYARMYPDANRSDVMIDRDERALQCRRIYRNSDNESQRVQKDYKYNSYAMMYPDVHGPNVIVDQDERALRFRSMCFNKEKEAYLENGSHQPQEDYESDSYARMYTDASRPSALMVNRREETPQYRRHHLDGGTRVYLDDESAQLGKPDQVHLHDREWEPDGRRELYTNDETSHMRDNYSLKSHMLGEPGEVVYENMAEVNYGNVERLGMAYEKLESGRFGDHDIAYDRIDKQYAVELRSSEQTRCLVDERSFGHDDQNHVSTSCPRIPVKERLGGRVKDPSFHVKNRLGPGKKGFPWFKNVTPNRKSHGKNQKNNFKAQRLQWGNSSKV